MESSTEEVYAAMCNGFASRNPVNMRRHVYEEDLGNSSGILPYLSQGALRHGLMHGNHRFQIWACVPSPVSGKDQAGWGRLCDLHILPACYGITYQDWYGLRDTRGSIPGDWEISPFEIPSEVKQRRGSNIRR